MASSQPLEIKVLYEANPGRAAPRRPVTRVERSSGTRGWVVLGFVNVAVAVALCYVTWWPIDREMYLRLMLRAPLDPEVVAAFANATMNHGAWIFAPTAPAKPGSFTVLGQAGTAAPAFAESSDSISLPKLPKSSSESAMKKSQQVAGTIYGWLALSTMSFCLLGMAGGAAWNRGTQSRIGRTAKVLAITATLIGVASAAGIGWTYGASYPVYALRFGMLTLLIIAVLVGATLAHRTLLINRLAGWGIIVSAFGSAIALMYLAEWGILEAKYGSIAFVAVVFAVHSLFGWLLALPIAARMR